MHKVRAVIYIIAVLLVSCKSDTAKIKQPVETSGYIIQHTSAVFKNAELIFEDEWKVVFRKLDDSQYIIFSNSVDELKLFSFSFISPDDAGIYRVSPDYMNIRFEIDYIETAMPDPVTGESISINRIVNITRIPGERYSAAGISSDVGADEFIVKLKALVRADDAAALSGMILYPVTVFINKKKTQVTDAEMFVRFYGQIFNTKVTDALLAQSLGDVQADSRGLVIGRGEIRIAQVNGIMLITEIKNR
ncbi:MAG TPA: hypothetical protein PK514_09985 [Spirochaetota bacterium]|nr:hypothetical protein [Spirochaetota bacterium]